MRKFLSVTTVKKYIPLMREYDVSKVARSPRGFLTAYLAAKGNLTKLGHEWIQTREGFIARHLAQIVNNYEPLFMVDGTPTRRHLALIAWAYSPAPSIR
jgi:hypothetical protein